MGDRSSLAMMRHGKTLAGSTYIGSSDVALSELGWQQMWQSVEQQQVNEGQWDVIISSPLQRCAAFATQLAQRLALPMQIEPALREYHFGDWEAKSALQVMDEYPGDLEAFWQDPLQYPPSGGESLSDFAARIDEAMLNLTQRSERQRLLIISHGGVMRYLMCRQANLPINEMLKFNITHAQFEYLDTSVFKLRATL